MSRRESHVKLPDATKAQLSRFRKLRRTGTRHLEGQFVADSPKAVQEAVDVGASIELILVTDAFQARNLELLEKVRAYGIEVARVDEATMSSCVSVKSPQGIAALVAIPDEDLEKVLGCETIAVLDEVQDPGNVGALLRSADCFGAGVLLGKGCADPYSPKVVRSSAGALFRTPFVRDLELVPVLEGLKTSGFQLVGADPEGSVEFDKFTFREKCAIVLGNEGAGVSAELDQLLEARIVVPMQRKEQSLNVAIAGSLILYAACTKARHDIDMAAVVSAISHDLRSPLTSVKGFAQTIEKRWGSLDEELKKEMVGQISAASDRLLQAIGELVDTARLEAGDLRCNPIEFDPAPIVAGVLEEVRSKFGNVDFEILVEDSLCAIYADRERFVQAIRVLIENAAKHGGGAVRVSSKSGDGWVDLDISDNGELLNPDEIAQILNGCAVGRKGGAAPSGTGLALHVVARVAALQGGKLLVTESSDGFKTFTLRLPKVGARTDVGTMDGDSSER